MAPNPRLSPNINHAVVLAGILLFSLGVLLGAALPVTRVHPRRPFGMNMNGYDSNLDALLVSQASDGFAVLPGVDNKHGGGVGDGNGSEDDDVRAAAGVDEESNAVGGGMARDGAAECKCPGKSYDSTADPAAKSAAELMLAEPKLSLEDAMKRIDALSRSRTHLGKEKQNLEGERNALNKVVKEIKLEVTQCQKELKKLKIGRAL